MNVKSVACVLIAAASLSACASNPKQTILQLDERDPKFASRECVEARNIALQYDDKVLARTGTGLALGLLLGPFGLPFAAAADMNQNQQREYLNKEIDRRCKTQPFEAISAAQPSQPAAQPAPAGATASPSQPASSALAAPGAATASMAVPAPVPTPAASAAPASDTNPK